MTSSWRASKMELTVLRQEIAALRAESDVTRRDVARFVNAAAVDRRAGRRLARSPDAQRAEARCCGSDAGNRQNQSDGDAGRTARHRAGVRCAGIGTNSTTPASTRRNHALRTALEASEQKRADEQKVTQQREALLALHSGCNGR